MNSWIHLAMCVFVFAQSALTADTKVKVGFVDESVTLRCDLPFAKPSAQVTWSDLVTNSQENVPELIYNGKTVADKHMYSSHFSIADEFHSLTISKLTEDMTGEYICMSRINDTYTAKLSYRLDIVERAKCMSHKGTELVEGQSTTIYCRSSYSGYHVPVLRWTRKGQPVNSSDKAPSDIRLGMSESYQGINLDVTGDDDKAEYVCHMTVPDKGAVECKVTLNVKHSLRKVEITPASNEVHANQQVTCTGRANPAATVTLKTDVEGVTPVIGSNVASLKVNPAWIGRTISVECTATADNGSHKHTLDTNATFKVLEQKPDPQSATAGGQSVLPVYWLLVLTAAAACLLPDLLPLGGALHHHSVLVSVHPLLLVLPFGLLLVGRTAALSRHSSDIMTIIIIAVIIAAVVLAFIIIAVICVCKKRKTTSRKVTKEKSTKEEEKKLYNEEAKA